MTNEQRKLISEKAKELQSIISTSENSSKENEIINSDPVTFHVRSKVFKKWLDIFGIDIKSIEFNYDTPSNYIHCKTMHESGIKIVAFFE